MKNLLMKFMLIFSALVFFTSCEEEILEDSQIHITESNENSKTVSQMCNIYQSQSITSTYFDEIRSVNLPFTGISSSLGKNILVLPDITYFYSTVDQLDLMIESHNDAFDILTAGMTAEQADDYTDTSGFNEDQPVVDFENQLQFSSLRKIIENQYNTWLNLQGDVFDYTTDPDNHFIEDETERALLGTRADVILGNCRIGFIYYRFFDWGYVTVPMDDFVDAMDVINDINLSSGDQSVIEDIIKNAGIGNTHGGGTPPNIPCSTKLSQYKSFSHSFSNNRKIDGKIKFDKPLFDEWNGNQKIFVKTKSFRKKNNKWKKFRANIYAGFYGKVTGYDNCNVTNLTPEGKSKKRKRLKKKKYYSNRYSFQDNHLYAKAMQEGNQISVDFWD